MSRPRQQDSIHKLSEVRASVPAHVSSRGERWRHGFVSTPDGIVGIYSDERTTVLYFAQSGRRFVRTIPGKGRTERGLAILAGRFAREVAR